MDEFIGRLFIYFIIFAIAGLIGNLIRKSRNKADLRGMPEKEERYRLLEYLRSQRARGASHTECMQYLQSQGLRKGVAQGLLIDLESEQPADVNNPKTIIWNSYTCEYPGNWKVEPLDQDLGYEAGITIEGSGSGSLIILKEIDNSSYNDFTDGIVEQLKDFQSTPITEWGNLPGKGQKLSGDHKEIKLPVKITIFKPESASPPYILAEHFADEEEKLVKPGFELIRSTFKLVE